MDTGISHNLLEGKRGLIFGVLDEQSLAWKVARQCYAEKAKVVLTNSPLGAKMGNIDALSRQINSEFVTCDATDVKQIRHLLQSSMEILGGKLDFILHAIAFSNNIRRHRKYDDVNYTYYLETLDVSALSLHKLLQEAKSLDAISEWGSVVSLTYLSSRRPVAGYVDMGDAKALLEAITRSFGMVYGEAKHVRINTVSQSPTKTRSTAHFEKLQTMCQYTEDMSPLGNADGEACAKICVMLFSDYTRYITMQTIYNDGGFSATGLTETYMSRSPYSN